MCNHKLHRQKQRSSISQLELERHCNQHELINLKAYKELRYLGFLINIANNKIINIKILYNMEKFTSECRFYSTIRNSFLTHKIHYRNNIVIVACNLIVHLKCIFWVMERKEVKINITFFADLSNLIHIANIY